MALSQEQLNQLGNQLNGLVSKFTTKNFDLHQRRVTNAAPSVDANDYVVQDELTEAAAAVTLLITAYIARLARVFDTKNNAIIFNKGNVTVGPIGVFRVSNGPIQCQWTCGEGDPEGVVYAATGSLWSRTDGGAGSSLYVKESGDYTTNTGWAPK